MHCSDAVVKVLQELDRAQELHRPLASHHEAYAVIREELEEYWDEVKLKAHERSHEAMVEELVQIAAMALRALIDLE